jgi:sodium pump decarboxylase gamma subunit
MLLAGLKLMFIGMATVVLFLLLMIVLIQIVSKLTVNIAAKELAAIKKEKLERARRANEIKLSEEGDVPIAVFAAAIAAFEEDAVNGN